MYPHKKRNKAHLALKKNTAFNLSCIVSIIAANFQPLEWHMQRKDRIQVMRTFLLLSLLWNMVGLFLKA